LGVLTLTQNANECAIMLISKKF